ncbi:MAG: hypothetical protein ACXADW_23670 [Candidatus Hodarchaeales archaeon]|jgi:predicted GH43/DUF377 family glycosyl hydrolase
MRWWKRGPIYKPKGDMWWSRQRAYLPTVDVLEDVVRVYFASMDEHMIGRVGYVDLDKYNLQRIVKITKKPVLSNGPTGQFDESGVTPSAIINSENLDCKYMLYYGWMKTIKAPQILFTGMARECGETFMKHSRVPVLDRNDQEPLVRSAAMVVEEHDVFRIYYTAGLSGFDLVFNGKEAPTYTIRQVKTPKLLFNLGILDFHKDFKDLLGEFQRTEFGLARPWVVKDGPRDYKMWYAIRSLGKPYYIGYAESKDGDNWVRKDNKGGLNLSDNGWDSEMVCFPCVVDIEGKRYMFYNGNNHGETGFGYAEWA